MEIQKYTIDQLKSDSNLRSLTMAQLQKDFHSAGVAFRSSISIDIPYDELESLVAAQLKEIQSHTPGNFQRLLYTIDLPESDFRALKNSPDYYGDLAQLVIKREFLKVMIRTAYQISSSHDNT